MRVLLWARTTAGVTVEVLRSIALLHPLALTITVILAEMLVAPTLLADIGTLTLTLVSVQLCVAQAFNALHWTHTSTGLGVEDKPS